jgi:hypothetical protein
MLNDLKFESNFWGDCCNTFDEDQKHYVYAKYMKLDRRGYSFDLHGKSVVDIGGGPTSILLKSFNFSRAHVVDPIQYPDWTLQRYKAKGVEVSVMRGEDWFLPGFDECWIYNCLQHTEDPKLIIQNGIKSSKVFRIFEWIDIPPHEGHPQMLTKDFLDECIGSNGTTVTLSEAGCFGTAYINIKNKE